MFDSLTEKLGTALRNLRGIGKLSEEKSNLITHAADLAPVIEAFRDCDRPSQR